jgi:hypothetical protein
MPDCGGCTILDGVTITGKQTWADKLWNSLWNFTQRFNEIHGYQYMSASGSGMGWNEFSRQGIADNIIMDPITGLVVFKGVNGKIFKWDGRTPIPNSGWEPLFDFMEYTGKSVPTLMNAADGIKLLVDYNTNSYHKSFWAEKGIPGKPRVIDGPKGIIYYDSVPVSSPLPDTLFYKNLTPNNSWGKTQKLYDLLAQ